MSAIGFSAYSNYSASVAGQGSRLASAPARSTTGNVAVPNTAARQGTASAYCPTCNGGGASKSSSSASAYCPTCNGGASASQRSSVLPSATYSRAGQGSSQANAYCPTCNGGGASRAASSAASSQARQGGTVCVACSYNK